MSIFHLCRSPMPPVHIYSKLPINGSKLVIPFDITRFYLSLSLSLSLYVCVFVDFDKPTSSQESAIPSYRSNWQNIASCLQNKLVCTWRVTISCYLYRVATSEWVIERASEWVNGLVAVWLTDSLTHPPTYPLAHSLARSLAGSLKKSRPAEQHKISICF